MPIHRQRIHLTRQSRLPAAIAREESMPDYNSPFCQGCPYHPSGRLALAPTGERVHQPLGIEQRDSSTLLVARAPGVDEWEAGKPLISPNTKSAAHRIRKSLDRIKKERSDLDITNVVLCYPGKPPQKPDGKPPRDNPPDRGALIQCRHWLQQTISSVRYTKIVTFGKEAEEAVKACALPMGVIIVVLPHPSSGRLTNETLDAALS